MLTIKSPAAMRSTIELLADLRHLLEERLAQLEDVWEDIDIVFLIVQVGDSAADAERTIGFSLLQNIVDHTIYGQPDFTPSWEWIERHDCGWLEAVFVTSDDGSGVSLFVQNHPDTDAQLLALFNEFAEEEAAINRDGS